MFVLRQETPQNILRVFLFERFRRRGWRRFVARLPKGKGPNVFVALGPGLFAQIFAAEAFAFAKEQGVKLLTRLEGALGSRAGVRSMLDRPIVCRADSSGEDASFPKEV